LRVWNAATLDHPSRSNCARVSRGHEERAVLRLEAPVGEHLHRGPARFTRPGSSPSGRPGARRPWCGRRSRTRAPLSMAYFSVTRIVQDGPVVRVEERDVAATAIAEASAMGGRQRDRDRPEEARGRAHAVADPLPSAWVMKPRAREPADAEHDEVALLAEPHLERRQLLRPRLLGRAAPGYAGRGLSAPPPWGFTRRMFSPRVVTCSHRCPARPLGHRLVVEVLRVVRLGEKNHRSHEARHLRRRSRRRAPPASRSRSARR